MISGGW